MIFKICNDKPKRHDKTKLLAGRCLYRLVIKLPLKNPSYQKVTQRYCKKDQHLETRMLVFLYVVLPAFQAAWVVNILWH